MKTFHLLVVLHLTLVVVSCQKKAADEIDYGTVTASVYRNAYFGLTLPLPKNWNLQDLASREQLARAGTSMIAGDQQHIKALIKASEQQTVNLMAAFLHPVGSAVSFNPSVSCIAERVRHMPAIKRGRDYHFHARALLSKGQVKVDFPGAIEVERLGGVEFDVMAVDLHVGDMIVRQRHYATIAKGYALLFIITFTTPEEEAVTRAVLQGLHFH